MIHITKIKYKRKILVRQPLDVSNIRGNPKDELILILPDDEGLIDLSMYEYPYHIVQRKNDGDLFICFRKHNKSTYDNNALVLIWESEEALYDRVLFCILDR